jgi:hypothetical protein
MKGRCSNLRFGKVFNIKTQKQRIALRQTVKLRHKLRSEQVGVAQKFTDTGFIEGRQLERPGQAWARPSESFEPGSRVGLSGKKPRRDDHA